MRTNKQEDLELEQIISIMEEIQMELVEQGQYVH